KRARVLLSPRVLDRRRLRSALAFCFRRAFSIADVCEARSRFAFAARSRSPPFAKRARVLLSPRVLDRRRLRSALAFCFRRAFSIAAVCEARSRFVFAAPSRSPPFAKRARVLLSPRVLDRRRLRSALAFCFRRAFSIAAVCEARSRFVFAAHSRSPPFPKRARVFLSPVVLDARRL